MENLSQLKTQVLEYLSGLTAFGKTAVVAVFPDLQRSYPLKKPVITVAFEGVELSPAGLGRYLGGADTPLYGADAVVTLEFGLYCPQAETCDALYEALSTALLNANWAGILKISRKSLTYNAKTAAYHLSASATVRAAWLAPAQQERLFTGARLTY